jgi:hydrophobe/amphiphile efflux-1 (HAE1) family protein
MNISEPFIRRPIATTLLSVALCFAGAVAYFNLAVASLPSVDLPTLRISASQPGADPETMAATVAAPLERRLGEISGVTELTSNSQTGSTSIAIQFDISKNVENAARDAQAAINAAQADLPGNLSRRPTVRKLNPAAAPIMILALTSPIRRPTDLYDIADLTVSPRISQVEGIAEVQVGGAQQPAVRVTVDPAVLKARGMGLDDIRNAIASANLRLPLGRMEGANQAVDLSTGGGLWTPEQFAALVVKQDSSAIVRLSDIARVEHATSNRMSAGWFNKEPAVLLIIQKTAEGNVVETVDQIRALLPEVQRLLPADVTLSIMTDRTTTIRQSVYDLQLTLMASIALVTMVVFIFLRRIVPTMAAMFSVPLSLAGTVVLMWFSGFTLDNISLLALTISVGFVVDDAIVVIENCYRNMERGLRPAAAALAGARQIGFTIISISLSLIAAFIPLLFMGGVLGRVLQAFSWTLAYAIVISAVVSLTLTPMICGRFVRKLPRPRETWLDRFIEPYEERLTRFYERTLDWALAHRWLMLASTLTALALTIQLFIVLPKDLVPQGDTGFLFGSTRAAPDVSYDALLEMQKKVTDIVLEDPDVASVGASVGGSSGWGSRNSAQFYVNLKPEEERSATSLQVIDRLRLKMRAVPAADVAMYPAQEIRLGARGARSNYQITLWSTELKELVDGVPRVVDAMKKVPGLADVNTDREQGGSEIRLNIDRITAARLGVSVRAINAALNNAFSQRQISTLYGDRNQYKVVLEIEPRLQRDIQDLSQIFVESSSGEQIALSNVATLDVGVTPLVVNHQRQFPSITISFNLSAGVNLDDALSRIMPAIDALHLPETIRVELSGDTQQLRQQQTAQPLLIVAAMIAVYLVLGILYEDLVHPLTILSTLPSAGLGALLTLHATATPLSLIALIGIILLIGIVKKNGIMMVDFALDAERTQGLSPAVAIRTAALERFRPILMTTLAATLGAVPLILAGGPGSELRQPLGLTIVGGLLVSQVLTIYTTPAIYLFLDRFRSSRSRQQIVVPDISPTPSER